MRPASCSRTFPRCTTSSRTCPRCGRASASCSTGHRRAFSQDTAGLCASTRSGAALDEGRSRLCLCAFGDRSTIRGGKILSRREAAMMNEAARFEHFTDRARKALQLANQEALRLCHEYLGTEHILLGIVQEGSGIAANVLKNLDIDLLAVKREVEKIVPPGQQIGPQRDLPWTPRTKKVIEYATEEAAKFGLKRVGTEHLFLGLLREEESIAAEVLTNLGVRFEQVVEEILNLHGGMDYAAERTVEGTLQTRARSKTPALDSFGRDLTLLARRGKLDP